MAGYDGFSKSNNARSAEQMDRYPATILAKKLTCRPGAIKALMQPTEWHHTSSRYNTTDYYDGSLLLEIANERESADEEDQEVTDLLVKLRAWRPAKQEARQWIGCYIEWLEWEGSRKHPTASACSADGCTITHKGGVFVTIEIPDRPKPMRKKIGSRGFRAMDADGKMLIDDYMVTIR